MFLITLSLVVGCSQQTESQSKSKIEKGRVADPVQGFVQLRKARDEMLRRTDWKPPDPDKPHSAPLAAINSNEYLDRLQTKFSWATSAWNADDPPMDPFSAGYRLVIGFPTTDHPAVGGILQQDAQGYSYACTAWLADCDHVVTTNHCISAVMDTDAPKKYMYFQHTGFHEIDQSSVVYCDEDDPACDAYGAEVALVRLKEPVVGITPLKIGPSWSINSPMVDAVGFGTATQDGKDWGLKRSTRMDINFGAGAPNQIETSSVVDGQSLCAIDSGSPLLAWIPGSYLVVGIAHGVGGSCQPPNQYYNATNPAVVNWLDNYIDEGATCGPLRSTANSSGGLLKFEEEFTTSVTKEHVIPGGTHLWEPRVTLNFERLQSGAAISSVAFYNDFDVYAFHSDCTTLETAAQTCAFPKGESKDWSPGHIFQVRPFDREGNSAGLGEYQVVISKSAGPGGPGELRPDAFPVGPVTDE